MFFISVFSLVILINVGCKVACAQNVLLKGDVNIAVILNNASCHRRDAYRRTIENSALWVVERVNFLEMLHPLKMGLTVYNSCTEPNFFKAAFDVYLKNLNSSNYTLGIVLEKSPEERERRFSEVLELKAKLMSQSSGYLVKAAVKFLQTMGWRRNVTLVTTDERIVDLFYSNSKKERVCLKSCHVVEDPRLIALNATGEDPLVFFGTSHDITRFMANDTHLDESTIANNVLLIPLDGNLPLGIPEEVFVILPPHWSGNQPKPGANVFPTPLLFEIADPVLKFAVETRHYLKTCCNDTLYKLNCLRESKHSETHGNVFQFLTARDMLGLLKIEVLEKHFVYDIFRINDSAVLEPNIFQKPLNKILSYNMFNEKLTFEDKSLEQQLNSTDSNINVEDSNNVCPEELIIFRSDSKIVYWKALIAFREDSWIYAFLSLSLLGVIFCVAVLVFLLTAIFQKRILEGNPSMTLLLLFAVMLVFCAVLPFSVESAKSTHKSLCTVKVLSITLSYAAVFSLLLSRAIVLSSAAKEVGFMSHIAGQVQSFLCLFIFGVQAALSLHVIGSCNRMFTEGYDFLFLMSYNSVLLLILLCLTPLMYKSQRNYREGKYITIAIALIAVLWSVWLPSFAILCNEWKEMMVCLGLVGTGGICLGTIFIPRTYLMTIAAERDKITSALPSLNTATSGLDIYRAHPQPIYDCINVAAINAATVARAGIAPTPPDNNGLHQPDLYSCPALPEDLNFELCCDSPTHADKVTRF